MKTPETSGEKSYIYYPIEYVHGAFSNVIAFNTLPPADNWVPWIKSIDKSKFLDGMCADYAGTQQNILFDLISVGF